MTGKILITGGAGFIGSSLAIRLKQLNYELVIFDNLSPQVHGDSPLTTSSTYSKVLDTGAFIKGDVRNSSDIRKALDGVQCVVHLAAETGTAQSMYNISNYCDVNVQGTAVLLEEISKHKQVRKIIVASSRAVYGEGQYLCSQHGLMTPKSRNEVNMLKGQFEPTCPQCNDVLALVPTQETADLSPQSIYGITKLSQELMTINISKANNLDAIALRFQNVYGPGQSLSNPYTGILSIFTTRARKNSSINIFEDGNESRDFVYIDDVVQSLILGIESKKIGQFVYNVGSGKATKVSDVVRLIIDYFKSTSETKITKRFRVGDIRHNLADLDRVQKGLGYYPKVNFSDGISMFLDWASSQQIFQDSYEKSLEELESQGLLKS